MAVVEAGPTVPAPRKPAAVGVVPTERPSIILTSLHGILINDMATDMPGLLLGASVEQRVPGLQRCSSVQGNSGTRPVHGNSAWGGNKGGSMVLTACFVSVRAVRRSVFCINILRMSVNAGQLHAQCAMWAALSLSQCGQVLNDVSDLVFVYLLQAPPRNFMIGENVLGSPDTNKEFVILCVVFCIIFPQSYNFDPSVRLTMLFFRSVSVFLSRKSAISIFTIFVLTDAIYSQLNPEYFNEFSRVRRAVPGRGRPEPQIE